jgi:hypothetical protein
MAATGIGTWTALASNPATTIFTNQNIPTSIVSGFTVPGTYGFIWAGDTMTVTVNANTLVVTDSAHINAPCYGMNGSICLSVSGGTPNYSYQWNSGQTTPCITGVAHFSYIVTVTDQNGCSATLSDSITQPDSLHISFTTQNTSCAGGSDGSIIAIVTGGTPAYTYVWAGGAFSNPLTGLTAGNYCLTVSDNNACTASGCDSVRSGSGSCPSVTPPVQSCYSGLPDPLTQPTFTSPGFNTSDSIFPCISQGVGVADTIFFTNFTTFPSGIIMDSLVIDSIFLPTGLCWSTHESNNTFPAGGSESILISGSTFDSVGQYKLRMVVTAYTNVGTFTDIDAEQFLGLIYRIRVICYGSSCPAIDNSSADSALMYIPYPSCPPLSTDTVWPGDADANHLVDNNDLLPIGLGYDSTGPLRTVAQQSILWQADSATLWSNYFTTYSPLVNFNNADCNGDGVINSDDTLAIVTNFGLTHAKSGGTGGPWRSGIPALKAVLSADTLYAGDTLTVTFVLGDSANTVADFYGIAFTYNFDPLVVDSTFTTMSFNDSWVGTSSNKISISKTFTDGEIYAAVTRIDHVAVSGYGPIAMASFKITTDNISGKTFSYYPNFGSISAITAIDQHGNKFPLNAGSDSSLVAFTPNGIPVVQTETLHMQPNPAHDRVTISAGNVIQEIRIIDIVGNEVINNTAINSKATSLNVSILSSGVYFVQVRTDKGAGTVKLVVER